MMPNMMPEVPSEQDFWELLNEYNDSLNYGSGNTVKSEKNEKIDSELWQKYGSRRAVLVLDMSGFTKLSESYGVVHFLSMIARMRGVVRVTINDYGGLMIKFFADNGIAIFPDTLSAIRFGIGLNRKFNIANIPYPDELAIYISCGIDFGDILIVDNKDCFGEPVNLASKLGEDIATRGQIMVTQNAMNMVPEDANIKIADTQKLGISEVEIIVHSVDYSIKSQ